MNSTKTIQILLFSYVFNISSTTFFEKLKAALTPKTTTQKVLALSTEEEEDLEKKALVYKLINSMRELVHNPDINYTTFQSKITEEFSSPKYDAVPMLFSWASNFINGIQNVVIRDIAIGKGFKLRRDFRTLGLTDSPINHVYETLSFSEYYEGVKYLLDHLGSAPRDMVQAILDTDKDAFGKAILNEVKKLDVSDEFVRSMVVEPYLGVLIYEHSVTVGKPIEAEKLLKLFKDPNFYRDNKQLVDSVESNLKVLFAPDAAEPKTLAEFMNLLKGDILDTKLDAVLKAIRPSIQEAYDQSLGELAGQATKLYEESKQPLSHEEEQSSTASKEPQSTDVFDHETEPTGEDEGIE